MKIWIHLVPVGKEDNPSYIKLIKKYKAEEWKTGERVKTGI